MPLPMRGQPMSDRSVRRSDRQAVRSNTRVPSGLRSTQDSMTAGMSCERPNGLAGVTYARPVKSSRLGFRSVVGALIAFVCVGCSHSGLKSAAEAPPPPASHSAKAKPLPRLLAPRPQSGDFASLSAQATPPERVLASGVDRFCRAWYLDQRVADQQHPTQARQFAAAMIGPNQRLVSGLQALSAPPPLTQQFDGFVANEQRMVAAWQKRTSRNPTTEQEGSDEYDTALVLRHAYGRQFGSPQCDGMLPPAQATAAERAAQRFDLTTDPSQGCVSLVTPQFVPTEWGNTSDPMATCLEKFHVHRLGSLPIPKNIRIESITGVEDLSATVTYREIPDCGCGTFTTRLYFEHGRWLVRNVTTG
jgi:hypothetical protein